MLPQGYEQPAAIVLLLGGALACFAGYRLFRIVLGVYGFLIGAVIASSVVGISNTSGMLIAAILGGIVCAVVLVLAWFVGVALVGAGIGALIAHLVWSAIATGDPPALTVIVAAAIGAVAAIFIQRYVIIVGTAFSGAWSIVLGLTNLFPARGLTPGGNDTEVWILYPTSAPGRWAPVAWVVLGLLGTAVQLSTSSARRKS